MTIRFKTTKKILKKFVNKKLKNILFSVAKKTKLKLQLQVQIGIF